MDLHPGIYDNANLTSVWDQLNLGYILIRKIADTSLSNNRPTISYTPSLTNELGPRMNKEELDDFNRRQSKGYNLTSNKMLNLPIRQFEYYYKMSKNKPPLNELFDRALINGSLDIIKFLIDEGAIVTPRHVALVVNIYMRKDVEKLLRYYIK